MKRTLIALVSICLLSIISFGQSINYRNFNNDGCSEINGLLKESSYKVQIETPISANQMNSIFLPYSSLKTAQNMEQRLDSVIWQEWDEDSGQYIATRKYENWYDAIGQLEQYIAYKWDRDANYWKYNYKNEYYNDGKNNPLEVTSYLWNDTTGQWIPDVRSEYIYNDDNKWSLQITSFWDKNEEQWLKSEKIEITFNNDGNRLLWLRSGWDKGLNQWVVSYKVEYNYNDKGEMTLWTRYNWDEVSDQWNEYEKSEYSNDEEGNITNWFRIHWDQSLNEWLTDEESEYTYDAQNNILQEVHLLYFYFDTTYVMGYKLENKWDTNGWLKQVDYYSWNDDEVDWLLSTRTDYSYGINGEMIQKHTESWDESQWKNPIDVFYYYSDHEYTNVLNQNIKLARIYPNPASEYITVEIHENSYLTEFEIYNLQGCKVITQLIHNVGKVSLNGLENGTYIYRIRIDNNIHTGKLIKF